MLPQTLAPVVHLQFLRSGVALPADAAGEGPVFDVGLVVRREMEQAYGRSPECCISCSLSEDAVWKPRPHWEQRNGFSPLGFLAELNAAAAAEEEPRRGALAGVRLRGRRVHSVRRVHRVRRVCRGEVRLQSRRILAFLSALRATEGGFDPGLPRQRLQVLGVFRRDGVHLFVVNIHGALSTFKDTRDKSCFTQPPRPQTEQRYGFSPVWISPCRSSLSSGGISIGTRSIFLPGRFFPTRRHNLHDERWTPAVSLVLASRPTLGRDDTL
ncbi:hypothetical protein EYF80_038954 [Liparis tanakae]|uniref:Uncharacterized protein n=1 Tax=Liparis tanakae TaxID=230148 RepID=A0A4Z2GCA5_9TELE|nr:hypothetical protein EYF80_038954 [Liparis tanakae]